MVDDREINFRCHEIITVCKAGVFVYVCVCVCVWVWVCVCVCVQTPGISKQRDGFISLH